MTEQTSPLRQRMIELRAGGTADAPERAQPAVVKPSATGHVPNRQRAQVGCPGLFVLYGLFAVPRLSLLVLRFGVRVPATARECICRKTTGGIR